jgi:hypothetical protein
VSTQKPQARSKRRRSGLLLTLALGAAAALVALAAVGVAPAEATKSKGSGAGNIVFVSTCTTGPGVNNPTGDFEIFTMNPNGKKLKQLTINAVSDSKPTLSPDGKKVAYTSRGDQSSNLEGDYEVYLVNADGSGQKNLSNSGGGVNDSSPDWGRRRYRSSTATVADPPNARNGAGG